MRVQTRKWLKNTAIQSIKAMAHSALASIGATSALSAVDFKIVGGTAMLAGIISILMRISDLPEEK